MSIKIIRRKKNRAEYKIGGVLDESKNHIGLY